MGRKTKGAVAPEPVQVEPLLSISEVMDLLHMGRDAVYRLIREEGLPSLKLGSRRKVVPSSLATWIKQREQSGI